MGDIPFTILIALRAMSNELLYKPGARKQKGGWAKQGYTIQDDGGVFWYPSCYNS